MSDAPLSIALECAARGWHVFPCKPSRGRKDDKQPLTKNGFKDATTDPERIRYFWERKPDAAIGIATGASGLVVVDLDVKNGAAGMDNWHELVAEHGASLEATTLVETPSGGMHVYYRANGHRVGSTAGKLAPGIDTRAEGGYVIAAGSPGYEYVDDHGADRLSGLPEPLVKRLSYATRAAALIPESALEIPEGRRDSALTSLAGTMRRKGMSVEAITAALAAENKAHCKPPLSAADVERIAGSVARYEPADPAAAEPAPSEFFIDWESFWQRDRSEEEWIYPDVLARGRGHALYASHKAGKSLLMLYMAAKVATGSMPVVVIYLDYEMTEEDVYDRLDEMGYGEHTDFSRLRYALLPTLPPLDTAAGAASLMNMLDVVQSDWPQHHLVVVLDTVSRAVAGKENDADTFRAFYSHTGIQFKRRGITWARLDHSGKSAEQGQRGSSSKGDDVDVVWKLTATQNGIKLHRELARMSWVPESVIMGQSDCPLCYTRVAGDWLEGTGELANILARCGLSLDASYREAREALRSLGEPRRKQNILHALKWRREKAAEGLAERFPQAAEQGAEDTGSGTGEEISIFEPDSGSGTARNQHPDQHWEPLGVTNKEPPVARSRFEPIEMGDM